MSDVRAQLWRQLRDTRDAYKRLVIPEFGTSEALRTVVAVSKRSSVSEWRAPKGAGWARYASSVDSWDATQSAGDDSPLFGEWLTPDAKASIHWRGAELVWRISDRPAEQEPKFSTGEFPALAQRLIVAGAPLPESAAPGKLCNVLHYDVYWGFDDSGALRRLAQRFAGFGEADIVVAPRKPRRRA